MKIEVNKPGKKEYYDEFLYIASFYKKIKKNTNKKIQRLTVYLKKYICYLLLSFILFGLFYYLTKNLIYIFSIGMLFLILIYLIIYLRNTNKMLNSLMNSNGTKFIEIDETGVEYKDSEKNVKINWKNIDFILLTKYSICFIPKEEMGIFISVSKDYKDKIFEGIKKYRKEKLIIDNENLHIK